MNRIWNGFFGVILPAVILAFLILLPILVACLIGALLIGPLWYIGVLLAVAGILTLSYWVGDG